MSASVWTAFGSWLPVVWVLLGCASWFLITKWLPDSFADDAEEGSVIVFIVYLFMWPVLLPALLVAALCLQVTRIARGVGRERG